MMNSVMFLSLCTFGMSAWVPTENEDLHDHKTLKVREKVVYNENVYKFFKKSGTTTSPQDIEYHTLPTTWKKEDNASN